MFSRTVALLFTILLVSACNATQVAVTGFALGSASFYGGKVHFVKDLRWALSRDGKPTEDLRLVGRDEWSVYLCGISKSYQVDYWTRWIKENNINKFQITSATVGIINGRNIGSAVYQFGTFKQTAFKSWVWTYTGSSSPVSLMETHRDEWSVYLKTGDGSLLVQIDYHRKWIRFRAADGIWRDVYQITGATYSTIAHRYGC